MKVEKHVHKLRRHSYKTGNAIYFCQLPDCNFKTKTALVLGKRSLCWRCGETFIMNEYSVRLAKPHCEKCHKPKTNTLDTEVIDKQIREFIPTQPAVSSINDLRSRLSGATQVTASDDEGEI